MWLRQSADPINEAVIRKWVNKVWPESVTDHSSKIDKCSFAKDICKQVVQQSVARKDWR